MGQTVAYGSLGLYSVQVTYFSYALTYIIKQIHQNPQL